MTFWSCRLAKSWQAKTIISPLSQCLRPLNLAGWWVTLRGSYPHSDMIFNQVILLDHVTIGKIYISTFTRLMATKFGIYTYFGKEVQRANASVVTDLFSRHWLLQIAVGKCSRNKRLFFVRITSFATALKCWSS